MVDLGRQGRLLAWHRSNGGLGSKVFWSPDGTILATDSGHTVRFRDTGNGKEIACLKGHKGWVYSVCFSPGGRLLASGSADHTVRLWDVATGTETGCLLHDKINYNTGVRSVSFSPDGYLLASGSEDFTIRLWDVKSRMEVARFRGGGYVQSVCFSPDGSLLAAGSGKTVRLWSVASGTEIACLRGHEKEVWSITFSPHGSLLASGSKDHTVRLWDVASGMETFCLRDHFRSVWSVNFSPDGCLLASGSADKTILLWNVISGKKIFLYDNDDINSVAFSPDGRRLASASLYLRFWDTSDLVYPRTPSRTAEYALDQWLTRQSLSIGRGLPDTPQQEPDDWVPHLEGEDGDGCLGILRPEEPGNKAANPALSPDGRLLASSVSRDKTVRLWTVANGREIACLMGHEDNVVSVRFSPDGVLLASGSEDETVRIWDVASSTEIARLRGHVNHVPSISFSQDGRLLASGSHDNTVRVWDVASGMESTCLKGHESMVWSVRFSPDGRLLASASSDATVRLWKVADGRETACLLGHKFMVWSVRFSPDGRLLASGGSDATVRLWKVEDGRKIACLRGHENDVGSVSFSPDGVLLASGSNDGTVRLWDMKSCREVRQFTFSEKYCSSLAWASSGAFLIAGLSDDTVRIFDTRDLLPRKARAVPKTNRPQTEPAPEHLRLTKNWLRLHRIKVDAPLSLLRDLDALLADQQPDALAPLHTHLGIRALVELRWPGPARTALLALLLRDWPSIEAWRPSGNITGEGFRQHLNTALSGEPCPPKAPEPPLAYLTQALESVDDRLLTLLQALGPKAVAADPGLLLRLRSVVGRLPRLNRPRRQLLGLRLTPLHAGPAQGDGTGQDRAGFSSRGSVTALVPSQWALPRSLLRWQYINGGLLYRARTGREPPQLRPTVIVLDTTPACWGPVESLTRPAAHALAESLAQQGMTAVLLTPGDNQVRPLSHPADRLNLLTHRSRVPADPTAVLNMAQGLCSSLADGHQEPVVLLLTHCHWGADQESFASVSRLRALFVQYPGSTINPAWAFRCERWETLPHTAVHAVAGVMGRLIG
ncbi:MAG: hypothetical protein GY800_00965 [Planctomycetes bacterium]|nr:hypothetical protein [Planctomycetota bacterium]